MRIVIFSTTTQCFDKFLVSHADVITLYTPCYCGSMHHHSRSLNITAVTVCVMSHRINDRGPFRYRKADIRILRILCNVTSLARESLDHPEIARTASRTRWQILFILSPRHSSVQWLYPVERSPPSGGSPTARVLCYRIQTDYVRARFPLIVIIYDIKRKLNNFKNDTNFRQCNPFEYSIFNNR